MKVKSKMLNRNNMHIHPRHTIMWQLLETRIITLDFVRLWLNLVVPLTKPLNRKLIEESLRRMKLTSNIKVKNDGNPNY